MKALKGILIIIFIFYAVPLGRPNVFRKSYHTISDFVLSISHITQRARISNLVKKLKKTNPINIIKIHEELKLNGEKDHEYFSTHNPYYPQYEEHYESLENLKYPLPQSPHGIIIRGRSKKIKYYSQESVVAWESNPGKNNFVCAIQFTDNKKFNYKLKSFPTRKAAENAKYMITHHGKCGMCSTLEDLAVYLAKPNLTAPARKCSKGINISSIANCYKQNIGFSTYCSEQWAYNSIHTRQRCGEICLEHYGFFNILLDRIQKPNIDKDGYLNICLACDEFKSGSGFKYGAGRTRRNSGIYSAIERDDFEIYKIDHYRYFSP